jgi:hypothetical protein
MKRALLLLLTSIPGMLLATFSVAPAHAAGGCWVEVTWSHIDNSVRATPRIKCTQYPKQWISFNASMHRDGNVVRWGEDQSWSRVNGPITAQWVNTYNPYRSQYYCLVYQLDVIPVVGQPEFSSTGRNCYTA